MSLGIEDELGRPGDYYDKSGLINECTQIVSEVQMSDESLNLQTK